MNALAYSEQEIAAIYRVIGERRDMRHFIAGQIPAETLKKLLAAAHQAPSVGLMQPWRFIRITDLAIRQQIHKLVDQERLLTAAALGERKAEFLQLKVEGIMQCAELMVAALCADREQYIFGRRTLPEKDLASVSCAIQNLWLAARAEGLGMGWVSLFDPLELAKLLSMPDGAKPVAILCLGPVAEFYAAPMLVEQHWASEKPLEELIAENSWQFL